MFGRRALKHENALLREALGWYANLEHWRSYGIRVNARTGKVDRATQDTEWSSEATIDRGQRANFILRLLDTNAADRARRHPLLRLRRFLQRQPKPMSRVTVPARKE